MVDLWRTTEEGTKIYVLAATADGKQRLFMVDTGASVSVLSTEVANELGLTVEPAHGELIGLSGSARWYRAQLPALSLGEHEFYNVDFAVGVPGVPNRAGAVPLAGILGNNVWRRFVLDFDYVANELEISLPAQAPLHPNAQPLHFNGQHVRTTVESTANNGDQSRTTVARGLTGAKGFVVSGKAPHTLSDVSSEGIEPLFGIGAGDDLPASNFLQVTRRLPIEAFEAGGLFVQRDLEATWINYDDQQKMVGPRGMPGLLGHSALDGHRVVIDYPRGWFYMEAPSSKADVHNIHEWALRQMTCSTKRNCTETQSEVLQRAQLLYWLERPEEAAKALKSLWEENPQDHVAGVYYARLLRREGALQQATALLDSLPLEILNQENELVALVNSHLLVGDSDRAMQLAEASTQAYPESANAWVALSDVARHLADYHRSRNALKTANQIKENPDGHLLRRAWIASLEGDLHAALTHVRRLVQLYPNGGVAPWFYALEASKGGEKDLFTADLARARDRLHPGDGPLDFFSAAYHAVGDSHLSLQLMNEGRARDCSENITGTSQKNCQAWYLGLAQVELAEARKLIESALHQEPNRAEFLDTLAIVLEAQGEIKGAKEAAFNAAKLVPDDVYLLWQANRLQMALTMQNEG